MMPITVRNFFRRATRNCPRNAGQIYSSQESSEQSLSIYMNIQMMQPTCKIYRMMCLYLDVKRSVDDAFYAVLYSNGRRPRNFLLLIIILIAKPLFN